MVTKPSTTADDVTAVLKPGVSLTATPALAIDLLERCAYARQRPLNEDRALLLADAMEQGTFLANTQISFARHAGRLVLVNGQHRLTAVTLAGRSAAFRVEIYDCANEGEVDTLYCRFDRPGGARTATQLSASLGLHDDFEGGLRRSTASLLLNAVTLPMMNFARIGPAIRPRATRDLDLRNKAAREWKPWAIEYQACLDQGVAVRTRRYRVGSVFAVGMATLRHQTARAREFWGGSIANDGLAANDPRAALHAAFLIISGKNEKRHEFDLAEMACQAWNAFYRERNLRQVRTTGGAFVILGTPYGAEE
jgi:hypothetical protein